MDQQEATTASVEERMARHFGTDTAAKPETAPAVEAESEAEVAEETPVEATEAESEPVQQAEEQPPADSLVEVEFEGKQLKVAPEIKDALMRHVDYTRKTMAHADQVRLFQQQQQIATLQEAFHKETAPDTQSLTKLEAQIEQFKALQWAEMDTDQIVRARQALDGIKEQRDEIKATLDSKRDKFMADTTKAREQLLQQGVEYLRKTVPAWGEIAQKDSAQAALSVGFTKSEVEQFMDPRAVHLAWKAAQWDKLQAGKPGVAEKVKTAPPVSKPGSAASTESTATKRYTEARANLKKTGSTDAAVAALLAATTRR